MCLGVGRIVFVNSYSGCGDPYNPFDVAVLAISFCVKKISSPLLCMIFIQPYQYSFIFQYRFLYRSLRVDTSFHSKVEV